MHSGPASAISTGGTSSETRRATIPRADRRRASRNSKLSGISSQVRYRGECAPAHPPTLDCRESRRYRATTDKADEDMVKSRWLWKWTSQRALSSGVQRWAKRAVVAAGLGLALTASLSVQAADPLKVAFVYVGPVGDGGWTFQHDLGRLAIEKEFGSKIKTTYVENVPETADAERVIRQLAADGNKIIFTTSFGYMEPTLKVAKMFPNTYFEHATGYKTAPNVSVYQARFYEGAYLLGIVAGKMTRSNTLGFVGSFPIP